MRLVGNDAALCHVDADGSSVWNNLVLYPRNNTPIEVGKTYNWKIIVTDGHILDFFITDLTTNKTTAVLRDYDIQDWIGITTAHDGVLADNFAGYLGIDAAIIYATGDAEHIDTSIDHPYNTYKHAV